jgi:hypothetical protein
MSDFYQPPAIGDRRNAPIWQVFAVVLVLMGTAVGSFMMGKQNPAPASSGYGTDSGYVSDYTDSSQSGGDSGYIDNSGGGVATTQYVTIYNLIGFGSTSVERQLRGYGLNVNTRYTTGDPSISAQLNDGCPVVDQNPAPGSQIPVGGTVVILADCPTTGNW